MHETELLTRTLELIKTGGVSGAYNYLVSNLSELDSLSSQVYNYLYCLASTSNKKNEALDWLEEAIIDKGMWYRPEVFVDEDLDNIRDSNRFTVCYDVSKERYIKALKEAKTICTWEKKKADDLLLVLHGNQQNIDICRESWDFLNSENYQVEYVQSQELDSYRLYRWEDEGSGPQQLKEMVDKIDWNSYHRKILCGFSAGCNVILQGIADFNIECEQIILQSPWIPMIKAKLARISKMLREKGIEVLIICGEEDDDCLQLSRKLAQEAEREGVNVEAFWVKGLGHKFPAQFSDFVSNYLQN